uniref:Uncharacterized protein n=1 Tax=Physcomitrium patens TaxID=3218 RepID=A0A2K1JN13_PHYPA|nr:hypothetical protein PHYPA_017769 [Physcomitrium patens]
MNLRSVLCRGRLQGVLKRDFRFSYQLGQSLRGSIYVSRGRKNAYLKSHI